jgi:hypothetical protein
MTKTTVAMPSSNFAVRYEASPHAPDHVVDFWVIQIVESYTFDGEQGIEYVDDSGLSEVYVSDIEKASIYMEGSLKWDGCINLHFPAQSARCCTSAASVRSPTCRGC